MWDEDFSKVATSNLYHVKVPREFAGKKYSKLFDYLTTRRNVIPLGLYRKQNFNMTQFMEEENQKGKKQKKRSSEFHNDA